jgi:hypothetical protein
MQKKLPASGNRSFQYNLNFDMISRKKNNDCGISVKRLYGYPTVLKIKQGKQRGHEPGARSHE